MKVSICIPTYKRSQKVLEAINSCLDQTILPYEILIGDDSPDELTKVEVGKIMDTAHVKIRYFKNQPSLGQVGNVNKLFDAATGDKIMLLHDDDLLMPNAIETLLNCFKKDPLIKVSYGKQYIIREDGTIYYKGSKIHNTYFYRTKEYEGAKLTPLEAGMVQQFPNNAYLIEADLAKKIKYRAIGDACDFDFGFRTGKSLVKFHYVDTYVSMYRMSQDSVTKKSMNDAGLVAYLLVKNTEIPVKSQKLKTKWLRGRSKVAVGQAIDNGKFKEAIKIYFSEDHIHQIFTPGGVKRLLRILLSRKFYAKGFPILRNSFSIKLNS